MKKKTVYLVTVLVTALAVYLLIFGLPSSKTLEYEFTTVKRGDISTTVSSTGALSPVTTVEVGTQVSGTLDSVFVDYNDPVKAGQIIAILDTSLLKASVLDAEASVERSEAQLEEAQLEFDRNKSLFERKLISESEFLPYKVALVTQRAALKSAEAALERAQRNLEYAVIRSPITGTVISRNIEEGQTVAASLSSPTLFVIAEDMSHMEILAEVDESDIGEIKEGQKVNFEVASHSGRKFYGMVRQIRLQPKTVSNVVTYTVVVEAANEEGLLLPGMTATMDFVTDSRSDVLLILNKALRFKPTDEQVNAFREQQQKRFQSHDSLRAGNRADTTLGSTQRGTRLGQSGQGRTGSANVVWFLDSLGQLAAAPFQPGLTDGSNTEVLASRVLKEGMVIILNTKSETDTKTATSNQQSPGGLPPMRRGF